MCNHIKMTLQIKKNLESRNLEPRKYIIDVTIILFQLFIRKYLSIPVFRSKQIVGT